MISKIFDNAQQIMRHNQSNIYIAPIQALSRYVAKYSISFANDNIAQNTITLIPDGSGCLIFTYCKLNFTSLLWGPTTKTCYVKNDMNAYPMQLYIELLPGGLFYLTGIKQSELTDLQMPLSLINNQLHVLVLNAFESAESLGSFIDKINSILLSYFQPKILPQVLFSAIDNIKSHNGCLSVNKIAENENYSERHMNRLFSEYLGMNVKTLSSIVRINHILQQMNTEKEHRFTEIAQTSGFYDQAHFIHTFKAICGVTPKVYFENMTDFYNEIIEL